MKNPRGLATGAVLCGTVVLSVWGAVWLGGLGSPGKDRSGPAPLQNPGTSATTSAPQVAAAEGGVSVVGKTSSLVANAVSTDASEPAVVPAAVFSADAAVVDVALPAPAPVASPESAPVQVATAVTGEPTAEPAGELTEEAPPELARASEPLDECLVVNVCIDDYLWSLYQRTPKRDTVKQHDKRKVTIKKNGKTRTVTKSTTKLVDEDFTWKDPKAADRFGMSMKDYVIGGMDRSFKVKLFRAMRAMDEAGLVPGITSAFRDDYRQQIASGLKASSNSSFHGGSLRGGYGHGLAADIVSVRGDTRSQRQGSSEVLWQWVDAHGKEYGIGRPYLDRDPPHVGPIDGREYLAHHGGGGAHTKHARADKKKHTRVAVRADHTIMARRAKTAKASRLSAI